MKYSALLQAGVLALTGLTLASNAEAAIITVINPSFETLPVGGLPLGCGVNCSYSATSIPGWTTGAAVGQFRPGAPINTTYFNTLSDGPTSAYSNGGTISQIVAPTVQLGVLYTLLVDIGWRKDQSGSGTAALTIGGTPILATGTLIQGTFQTFTATYTGLAADVGKTIGVLLSRTAGSQANFDNVRLSDSIGSAVPEPGTIGMMAAGLGALLVMRRKLFA